MCRKSFTSKRERIDDISSEKRRKPSIIAMGGASAKYLGESEMKPRAKSRKYSV